MASGLEIDEFQFLFGTPCTPEGAADLARRAPRRGRRIQSLRALRQAREEGFQKKIKYIEQIPFKINGNYIKVVSRGACGRKGTSKGPF